MNHGNNSVSSPMTLRNREEEDIHEQYMSQAQNHHNEKSRGSVNSPGMEVRIDNPIYESHIQPSIRSDKNHQIQLSI
jgi:hypothetical protein